MKIQADFMHARRFWPTPSQRLTVRTLVLGVLVAALCSAIPSSVATAQTPAAAWGWGSNSDGQLGDGTRRDRRFPVRVEGGSAFVDVDAGNGFSLALASDGTLWSWGYNSLGQLGDGTETNRTSPVRVGALTEVVDFAAGGHHSVALTADGNVWAWGRNYANELGGGSSDFNSTTPVQVPNLNNVIDVDAGWMHNVVLRSDGSVWAWGDNTDGQTGDEGALETPEPARVGQLSNVVQISAGESFNLALHSDGTVSAWGANGSGQLGDGTTDGRAAPAPVTGLPAVTTIAAGGGQPER